MRACCIGPRESKLAGVVGERVGQALRAAYADPGRVKVLNDTVAALLGGAIFAGAEYRQHIGLIVGTGNNMATFLPGSKVTKIKEPWVVPMARQFRIRGTFIRRIWMRLTTTSTRSATTRANNATRKPFQDFTCPNCCSVCARTCACPKEPVPKKWWSGPTSRAGTGFAGGALAAKSLRRYGGGRAGGRGRSPGRGKSGHLSGGRPVLEGHRLPRPGPGHSGKAHHAKVRHHSRRRSQSGGRGRGGTGLMARLLYFASLSGNHGLPGGVFRTGRRLDGGAVAGLSGDGVPALKPMCGRYRVAVDQQDGRPPEGVVLGAAAEIALIPPVSGGGGPWVCLDHEPIVSEQVLQAVRRPDCGAVLLFEGCVRDSFQGEVVERIDYSAYEAMAGLELKSLAEESLRLGQPSAVALWIASVRWRPAKPAWPWPWPLPTVRRPTRKASG